MAAKNVYIGSVQYTAVAQWAALTAYVSTSNGGRGDYVRQLAAPAVGSERVFRCTTSGTSLAAEPAWTLTKNAVNTEVAGPVWTECTGQEADQVSGTWTAPHARLSNAFASTWGAAGDTFEVANDHAQTQATALQLSSPGTGASPCIVQCVLVTAGTVPPVSADLRTTATITTTGASTLKISSGTCTYWYGITFNCGSGAVSSALDIGDGNGVSLFKNCAFKKLGTTANTSAIVPNSYAAGGQGYVVWDNCSVTFGSTGDRIRTLYSNLTWLDTATPIVGATVPTILFLADGSDGSTLFCRGVDFTTLGGGTLASMPITVGPAQFTFYNCLLHASTVINNSIANFNSYIQLINCDSSATNYRHEKYTKGAVQTIANPRTGGASDGTLAVSWLITNTASSKWVVPFISFPITLWNDITSAITLTIYATGAAIPNNDDIWIEVEYLGTTGPLGSLATSGKADFLAAGVAYSADTSAWPSVAAVAPFTMTATFTPLAKGPITVTIKSAKASTSFFVDPKPAISGVSVGKSFALSPGVYANESGAVGNAEYHIGL